MCFEKDKVVLYVFVCCCLYVYEARRQEREGETLGGRKRLYSQEIFIMYLFNRAFCVYICPGSPASGDI